MKINCPIEQLNYYIYVYFSESSNIFRINNNFLFYFDFDALGWAIDCFKCVSIDGDNKPCDDPFHNNGSLAFLESPCLGGRKGRDGLFPATACIKIAGIYGKTFLFL